MNTLQLDLWNQENQKKQKALGKDYIWYVEAWGDGGVPELSAPETVKYYCVNSLTQTRVKAIHEVAALTLCEVLNQCTID